jgi:hypothetical protein
MNFIRKILYNAGLSTHSMVYKFNDDKLYRMRYNRWGESSWIVDDPMLNLLFRLEDGQQCKVNYTDYGNIGSKCLYLFSIADDGGCIYSCESILVELSSDYKKLMGYFPKKMFYTKVYE